MSISRFLCFSQSGKTNVIMLKVVFGLMVGGLGCHVLAQKLIPQEMSPACIGFVPGGISLKKS